jgi:hypothetical protein
MSSLTVIGLCVLGIVIVYIGVGVLPIGDYMMRTKPLLRIVGGLTVVLLVGMAWIQTTNRDAIRAVETAESARRESQFATCSTANDFRRFTREADATAIAHAEDVRSDDEAALESAKEEAEPVDLTDIPGLEGIDDPDVLELIEFSVAQSAERDTKVVDILEIELEESTAELERLQLEAETYIEEFPILDCDAYLGEVAPSES